MESPAALYFTNPGEIDPRLITTLGVNVKESGGSPIGFFGTGLKYAIAGILRLGGRVEIWSGEVRYQFAKTKEEIRGKEFEFISMNGQQLGFTTELGKTWEPWMFYREIWCNAKDEGGWWSEATPGPRSGQTTIVVECPAFTEAHHRRAEFLLLSEPLQVGLEVDIHPGVAGSIFYRGLAVCKLTKPTLFTYNIKSPVVLREDRMADLWYVRSPITRALAVLEDEGIARQVVGASPEETFEGGTLDFDYVSEMSETMQKAGKEHLRRHRSKMNKSLVGMLERLEPELSRPEEASMSKVEKEMLRKAIEFCDFIGVPIVAQVLVTESLGSEILGQAKNQEIWIARRAFMSGTKMLAGTLFEEQLHLNSLHPDFSRGLQNWLVDKVMSLGEELKGEPI